MYQWHPHFPCQKFVNLSREIIKKFISKKGKEERTGISVEKSSCAWRVENSRAEHSAIMDILVSGVMSLYSSCPGREMKISHCKTGKHQQFSCAWIANNSIESRAQSPDGHLGLRGHGVGLKVCFFSSDHTPPPLLLHAPQQMSIGWKYKYPPYRVLPVVFFLQIFGGLFQDLKKKLHEARGCVDALK